MGLGFSVELTAGILCAELRHCGGICEGGPLLNKGDQPGPQPPTPPPPGLPPVDRFLVPLRMWLGVDMGGCSS